MFVSGPEYTNHRPRSNVRIRPVRRKDFPCRAIRRMIGSARAMPLTSRHPNSVPAGPTTAGARVDIWTIRLDLPPAALEATQNLLSPDELTRLKAFRNEQARRNYIISHAALRHILGDCLQVAPLQLQFASGPHGKPALAGPIHGRLEFNLTHSSDLALLALTQSSDVGIDIETVRPMPDAVRIAERFFSAAETEALKELPVTEQANAFLSLWTRKEAVAKGTGLGIANFLSRFEVTTGPDAKVKTIDGDPRLGAQWTLHAFEPAAGYLAAVAVRSPGAQFIFHAFQF